MRKLLSKIKLAAAIAASASIAAVSGCESAGESTNISISPSSASIGLNQSIALTASGGWDYRWSLADGSYGRLSSTSGESVVYTATQIGVTQTVTVTGMTGEGTGSSTNGTAKVYTATATIRQGETDILAVSGDSQISVGGDPVILTASGGDGVNYTWSLSNPSIGSLSGTTGNQVGYTASAGAGSTQTITVQSGTYSVKHVIMHMENNTISWVGTSSQTIGIAGSSRPSCTLRVENYTGSVKWYEINDTAGVTITPNGDSCTVSSASTEGTVTILAIDDSGRSVSCVITVSGN